MNRTTALLRVFTALLLAMLITLPAALSAQHKKKKKKDDEDNGDRDHSWDYAIGRNTPDSVSPYTISFSPFAYNLIAESQGDGLGAALGGKYSFSDKVEAFGDLTYYYYPFGMLPDFATQYHPLGYNPNYTFQLGATYFFSSNFVNKDNTIFLYAESGGYRTTINHITKIPLDHIQKWGVRGGYTIQNRIDGNAGSAFLGVDINNPSAAPVDLSMGSVQSNLVTGMFTFGIQSEKIKDYLILFQNGQKRKLSSKMIWYADVMLAAFSTYSNVKSDTSPIIYEVNKNNKTLPIGARIGAEFNNLGPFGGSRGFEMGFMPGAVVPEFYFMFRLGMAINPKGNK